MIFPVDIPEWLDDAPQAVRDMYLSWEADCVSSRPVVFCTGTSYATPPLPSSVAVYKPAEVEQGYGSVSDALVDTEGYELRVVASANEIIKINRGRSAILWGDYTEWIERNDRSVDVILKAGQVLRCGATLWYCKSDAKPGPQSVATMDDWDYDNGEYVKEIGPFITTLKHDDEGWKRSYKLCDSFPPNIHQSPNDAATEVEKQIEGIYYSLRSYCDGGFW